MRRSSILLTVVLGIAGASMAALAPAGAQAVPEDVWLGTVFASVIGNGCANIPVDAYLFGTTLSVYRPRLGPTTPVNSAISFQAGGTTYIFTSTDATDDQLRSDGTYRAVAVTEQVKTFSWKGSYAKFHIDPKTAVTQTTRYVTISGTLKGLFHKNCDLEFHGAYTAAPQMF
jgi:hypothetical protein